jgi:hypothetical protein
MSPFPWLVCFAGERPHGIRTAHELANEFAESIFAPASDLVFVLPSRPEFAIPYRGHSIARHSPYWGIGIYLGIIVRSGTCQPLPFAPLVWKYIAGERICETDVTSLDDELSDYFKALRSGSSTPKWSTTDWIGRTFRFPNHPLNSVLDIEDYIGEVVRYRVDCLRPFMDAMKSGFYENTGLSEAFWLTGDLLSRICQGNPSVSVQDLREVVRYRNCNDTDSGIQMFWAVVEEMTNEQRSLLLRFVTARTRFPILRTRFTFEIRLVLEHDAKQEVYVSVVKDTPQLNLPRWRTFEEAREKIVAAIEKSRQSINA